MRVNLFREELTPNKERQLAGVWIKDGLDFKMKPERRAVFPVIQDSGFDSALIRQTFANVRNRCFVGFRTLKKAAIAANNFLFGVTGGLHEARRGVDNRIIGRVRIGNDKAFVCGARDRAGENADISGRQLSNFGPRTGPANASADQFTHGGGPAWQAMFEAPGVYRVELVIIERDRKTAFTGFCGRHIRSFGSRIGRSDAHRPGSFALT